MPEQHIQPNIAIDIGIAIILITLLILGGTSPTSIDNAGRNHGNIWLGLYIVFIGLCFLLSYFYTQNSYIFRLLDWVCRNFSRPKGRKMAFFYFGLASCVGVAVIVGNI